MTLYGYARVSVREPEDKNLDLQDGPAAPLAFVSPAGQTARTRHLLWPAGHAGPDRLPARPRRGLEVLFARVERAVLPAAHLPLLRYTD